jgi:hypothetical protein
MQSPEQNWPEVARFFNHPVGNVQPQRSVKILGFGRQLLPVQAHAVWHALKMFTGNAGSLISGHMMGLGKTTIAFALHYVQHTLNKMYARIDQGRERHHSKKTPYPRCPSNALMLTTFGFDCPCHKESPTYFVPPLLGVTVVLAPVNLLSMWIEEGCACFPTGCGIALFKAHGSGASMSQQTKAKLAAAATNDPPGYVPTLANGEVVVITTSHSIQAHLLRFFSQGPGTTRLSGIVISVVDRDECHLERNKDSATIRVLWVIQGQQVQSISINALSGTALSVGPKDLAMYIEAMVREAWADDPILKHWMHEEAIRLGEEWDALCRAGAAADQARLTAILTAFRPLVELLVHRYTTESRFFGQPVVRCPRNTFETLWAENGSDEKGVPWNQRLSELAMKEKAGFDHREAIRRAAHIKRFHHDKNYQPLKKNLPNAFYKTRICASLPACMDLAFEDGTPLRLTALEWQQQTTTRNNGGAPLWTQGTSTDPYWQNREQIFASSGKLRRIRKLYNKTIQQKDAEGKSPRLVFASYFFVGAYMIYLVSRPSFLSSFPCAS